MVGSGNPDGYLPGDTGRFHIGPHVGVWDLRTIVLPLKEGFHIFVLLGSHEVLIQWALHKGRGMNFIEALIILSKAALLNAAHYIHLNSCVGPQVTLTSPASKPQECWP